MKFLDKIRASVAPASADAVPDNAVFATRPDTVYAPTTGLLITREEINDNVISSGFLGEGYGILPVGTTIYAPADGRISAAPVTNHSIGILTTTGVAVLIHIGLGTVEMGGKGFTRHVEVNQDVKAGQPLITFDKAAIRAAGHDDVITVVVSSPDLVEKVRLVGESNTLLGDRPLVKVGDPLMVIKR